MRFSDALLASAFVLASLTTSPALAKVSGNYSAGSVFLGYDNTCSSGFAGSLRYNSGDLGLEYCNGTGWVGLTTTAAGSGVIGGTSGVTLKLANGTAAAPSLTFYNESNTGMYYVASNTINWTVNGTLKATIDANAHLNIVGYYGIGGNAIVRVPSADTANSIAIGWNTLSSGSLTGTSNTAYGNGVLASTTSGSNNVGIGGQTLINNTTGSQNVGIGYQVLNGATLTGSNNTAVGYQAMMTATGAAANNAAMGASALSNVGNAIGNTAAGVNALNNNTANYNTAAGVNAAQYVTTSTGVVAVGNSALQGVSGTPMAGGTDLTAVGEWAAHNAQGAVSDITAVGSYALASITTGNKNTAVGAYALLNVTTGANNTAIGYQAGTNLTTGHDNTVVGDSAMLYPATSSNNVALGYQAMLGVSGTPLTGGNNVAAGQQALSSLQGGGANNVAFGYQAGANLTTGTGNVIIGMQAGFAGTPLTTGTNNTLIGYQAQANGAGYTNGTAIGAGAILTASNVFVMGTTAITKLACQTQTITAISDRRLKKDIVDLPPELGLDFIAKLRPVSYRFSDTDDDTLRYGFIAQDLSTALPRNLHNKVETDGPTHSLALVNREHNDERTYHIDYEELISPLVRSVQDLQKFLHDTETELAAEDKKNDILTQTLTKQEETLKALQADTTSLIRP
jgi:hypothetical protein